MDQSDLAEMERSLDTLIGILDIHEVESSPMNTMDGDLDDGGLKAAHSD